jgi:hypothetical protein
VVGVLQPGALVRLGAIVLMLVGLAGTWNFRHESMGPLWLVGYAVPGLCLAFVAGAAASRRLPDGPRRATMAATILLACGVWALAPDRRHQRRPRCGVRLALGEEPRRTALGSGRRRAGGAPARSGRIGDSQGATRGENRGQAGATPHGSAGQDGISASVSRYNRQTSSTRAIVTIV